MAVVEGVGRGEAVAVVVAAEEAAVATEAVAAATLDFRLAHLEGKMAVAARAARAVGMAVNAVEAV